MSREQSILLALGAINLLAFGLWLTSLRLRLVLGVGRRIRHEERVDAAAPIPERPAGPGPEPAARIETGGEARLAADLERWRRRIAAGATRAAEPDVPREAVR